MSEFSTRWYMDEHGVRWFCKRRDAGMSCEGENGHYTAAYFETFRKWGWTPCDPPART